MQANTNDNAALIEWEHVGREYGFNGTQAIIDHPEHGRLMITDGFGGIDSLDGGAVRWRHGMVMQLHPGDTFDSLRDAPWNDYMDLFDAVIKGCDDSRPVLNWYGKTIGHLAAQVGL